MRKSPPDSTQVPRFAAVALIGTQCTFELDDSK